MNRTVLATVGALALGLAPGWTSAAAQRVERGELRSGDETLQDGEYMDVYTLQGQPGQRVVLTLVAQDFDTFLILLSPSGKDTQNDDYNGDNRRSQIESTLDEAGEWRVVVTSYRGGETGAYTLSMDLGGVAAAPSPAGGKPPRGAAPAAAPRQGIQVRQGELAQGDDRLDSGEFIDVYTFQGVPGGRARIELRSNAFDTYLLVVDPNGEQTDNDDASQGETTRSLIELTTGGGEYRVVVTSYQSGESGPYELTIDAGGGAMAAAPGASGPLGGRAAGGKPPAAAPAAVGGGPRVERGQLEQGDETLEGGEYIDVYTLEGRPGQRVIIDLTSQAFDTYLMLRGPDKQSEDNDDFDGDQRRSRIETTLTEAGTFRIVVTSYRGGETGSYELRIQVGG